MVTNSLKENSTKIGVPVAIVLGVVSIIFWLGWYSKTITNNEAKLDAHTNLPFHSPADTRMSIMENNMRIMQKNYEDIKMQLGKIDAKLDERLPKAK